MSIGDEIRRRREEQGLTLSELARVSGVSKGYISEIETRPTARPSAGTLDRIANAMGATVAEILGRASTSSAEGEVRPALATFAASADLPEADVRMLAGVHFRGSYPETPDDYRFIYEAIRLRTVGR